MIVTATDFQNNFGKYLKLAEKDDLQITKNDKIVGFFTKQKNKKEDPLDGLLGVIKLPPDFDERKFEEERLREKYGLPN
ncbi:MAG: type II toxin-antitoxin system Phd/YefM family antitoxin [Candidatus Nomurabacteria bacterium]|jgi:hypothetical protein|nr:type II toxin-antitoxin system Phd/YefM family antitoxin [Candidatus Nomurabacteria bacterium]